MDYNKFKQDIRKESSKSTNVNDKILDDNERKVIDALKTFVESKGLTAKLVIAFK